MAIEFKRFMYSNKKIDTLRDYVTFFIRDWRSVLVKILDACCGILLKQVINHGL